MENLTENNNPQTPAPDNKIEITPEINQFFTIKKLFLGIIIIVLISIITWQLFFKEFGKACGGIMGEAGAFACTNNYSCYYPKSSPDVQGFCMPKFAANINNPFTPKQLPAISPTLTQAPYSPTPTIDPNLKTYTNIKYGFSFEIPIKGITQKGNEFSEIDCGNAIKETANPVLIDNLFKINILNWTQTIDDYLISKRAKDIYTFEQILNSNADEAVKVVSLKKGLEVASVGYPPLMHIQAIYKKDDNLFIIEDFVNPSNAGCINPNDLDHTKYSKYVDQNWNVLKSFKFPDKVTDATYCTKDQDCTSDTCNNCKPIRKDYLKTPNMCMVVCPEVKCISNKCTLVEK